MHPLLATAALALAAADDPASPTDPYQPAVHVEYGRAVLVQRGSRGELLLPQSEQTVSGVAYLLVGAGARVNVTWRGRSSLRVTGPAELEWAPGTEPVRGGATELAIATGDPTWSVLRLGEVDVEVRRGRPELVLPGGWNARLGEGAFFVSGNGRDACDFEVRAADALLLRPEARGGYVRPPVVVQTGMRVRLSDRVHSVSRPDTTADAGSWGRVSWPWSGGPGDAPSPTVTATAAPLRGSVPVEPAAPHVTVVEPQATEPFASHPILPFREGSSPVGDGTDANDARGGDTPPPGDSPSDFRARPGETFVETYGGTSTVDSLQLPRRLDRRGRAPISTARTSPVRFAPPTASAEPVTTYTPAATASGPVSVPLSVPLSAPLSGPASAPAFDAAQWNGRGQAELEPVGAGAFDRSPLLRATRIGPERWRVSLSARAAEPAWYFGRLEDIELQPGSSVTVAEDGFVQSTQGLTRRRPAPAGRPAFDELD